MDASPNLLTPSALLVRNSDIFASEIDNELVMMDDAQGLYFGLNPVARAVWERLTSPLRYDALLKDLTDIYDVDPEACRRDVEPFLQKMIGHGLIRVTPE
jgi:hypothetical protein